jgi:N-acetylmuramic acid 6-phosphate etherase
MGKKIRYDRLPTERPNPRSRDLDRLSAVEIARLMNRADRAAVASVARAARGIGSAVDLVVQRLSRGGRLLFVGAGTSGRLGVLEAAECPPTFDTPPALVQAVVAGGRRAVFRSAEGAEDDADEGARAVRHRVRRGDVVVGIAASGVTPFVRAALEAARRRKAVTVLVTCNPRAPRRAARVVIALSTGPEVLAGSTRLAAGTATKLVLNTLTTAVFVRLGKVYGNRMVDLRPRSAKLRARALKLVSEIGKVSAREAGPLLAAARGSVKLAILMARLGLTAQPARTRLERAAGSLRRALEGRRQLRSGWARRCPPIAPASCPSGSRSPRPRAPGAHGRGKACRIPG